jgi:NSS family neurotransmitter:Na+ symporter
MSHHRWRSDLGFLLGAVGAAVGLGSIWRFPYLTGTGGGFAFILVFVAACLCFGAPMLIAEAVIGRSARTCPQWAAGKIASDAGHSRLWNTVGWVGSTAGFLVTSYYTMIAGWVLAYARDFAVGNYARGGVAESAARFHEITSNWIGATLWQLAFFFGVAVISSRGVNHGVEFTNRWRAPALLVILLILAAYSLLHGDVERAVEFAFAPDFGRLTPHVVLDAVGQAFYALGICVGVMMIYGSYLPDDERLERSVVAVIASILLVSALATLAIFPLVFHYGLNPASGPELVFVVLPVAFCEMPAGRFIGAAFFILLVLAALTPTLALMEPWVAYLMQKFRLRRTPAVILAMASCWVLGQGSVLSFGRLADWKPLSFMPRLASLNVFGVIDFFSANILMPLSTLLVSVFLGWRVRETLQASMSGGMTPGAVKLLELALRYVCPLGVTVVLMYGLMK